MLRTYFLKKKRKDCIAVHLSEKRSFLVWIKKNMFFQKLIHGNPRTLAFSLSVEATEIFKRIVMTSFV